MKDIPKLTKCGLVTAFKCVESVKMENVSKLGEVEALKEGAEKKRKEEEEQRRKEEEEEKPYTGVNFKELLILAVATSIDALAVGVTFAFLQVNIVSAITIIGCTTFVLSIAGVYVGNVFGSRYKSRAELTGGIILILIGLKILLEHLGVIAF